MSADSQKESLSTKQTGVTFIQLMVFLFVIASGAFLLYLIAGNVESIPNVLSWSMWSIIIGILLGFYVVARASKMLLFSWDGMAFIMGFAYWIFVCNLMAIAYYIPQPIWIADIFFAAGAFMTCFLGYQLMRIYLIEKIPAMKNLDSKTFGWASHTKFFSGTLFYGIIIAVIFGILLWIRNFWNFAIAVWITIILAALIVIGMMIYNVAQFPKE
jgi:hypothetical protein